jgi:hypothetical protein
VSRGAISRRKRRRLQLLIALVAALAGLALLFVGRDDEGAAQTAERLSTEHHVRVAFGDPANFYLPPYGSREAHLEGVDLAPADASSAKWAIKGIERALRQYPDGFVAKLIGAIFIAGEVRIADAIAGGTIGPNWIILAAPARIGRESIYATSFIGVHHELSSFVIRRDPDTWQQWMQFSPPAWQYRSDPKEKIGTATAAAPPPGTGFLSAYGSSSLENDFNVYAEKMFTEPEALSNLGRAHDLIRRKMRFVAGTYVDIDPRMADVFRGLALE